MNYSLMFNFVKNLASNEAVQNVVLSTANSWLNSSTPTTPTNDQPDCKITSISSSKLNELEKLDRLNGFSCYFDRKTEICHVILLTKPTVSVWNGTQQAYAKQLACLLDPMVDVTEESSESIRNDRLKILLTTVSSRDSIDFQPIHLASACGFTKALQRICGKDPQVSISHATRSGLLPLHIAVHYKQIDSVRYLVNQGAPLNKGDSNGRTVLHYGVQHEDTKILELLLSNRSIALNAIDGDGCSPLFLSLQSNRPLSTRRLLDNGAESFIQGAQPVLFALVGKTYTKEMEECIIHLLNKYPSIVQEKNGAGQSIFHTGLDKNVLSCLLLHSNMTSYPLDSHNRSPLSLSSSNGDIDSLILFLSYNADPNEKDDDGLTPLHRSVMAGDAVSTKALLLFGGDPTIKTKDGKDVESLTTNVSIAHALRLMKGQSNDKPIQIGELEAFQLNRALREISKGNTINVMSLDGGGIRGLVLIELLSELERIHGSSFLNQFSWLAGTSTGAILALALSQGKTINECRKLYFRFKDRIFCGRRPYSEKVLEEFLKKEFGHSSTLDSLKKKRVVVTTCIGTLCPPELHLYRSYTAPLKSSDLIQMGYEDPSKTTIWYAARCSSAAPSYFAPVDGKWMDGGLVANNPIGELLQDVSNHSDALEMRGESPLKLGVVLSLGTGRQQSLKVDSINLDIPSGVFSLVQSFETLKHLKNVLVEQIVRADGPIVNRAKAWTASKNGAFFRFSPEFETEIQLDETSNTVLIDMLWKTKVYMNTQKEYTGILSNLLHMND